eukprot:TRINITY_DN13769_c0_g1_i1.p1 TRINITY_DN13769_c0_g1~~TRINITY_DN13769_c0_g1_i1.p1  ORF type:complete len:1592 (+),score=293.52 TRINITY_DN13769_c0_g1_i1:39-4814(+)
MCLRSLALASTSCLSLLLFLFCLLVDFGDHALVSAVVSSVGSSAETTATAAEDATGATVEGQADEAFERPVFLGDVVVQSNDHGRKGRKLRSLLRPAHPHRDRKRLMRSSANKRRHTSQSEHAVPLPSGEDAIPEIVQDEAPAAALEAKSPRKVAAAVAPDGAAPSRRRRTGQLSEIAEKQRRSQARTAQRTTQRATQRAQRAAAAVEAAAAAALKVKALPPVTSLPPATPQSRRRRLEKLSPGLNVSGSSAQLDLEEWALNDMASMSGNTPAPAAGLFAAAGTGPKSFGPHIKLPDKCGDMASVGTMDLQAPVDTGGLYDLIFLVGLQFPPRSVTSPGYKGTLTIDHLKAEFVVSSRAEDLWQPLVARFIAIRPNASIQLANVDGESCLLVKQVILRRGDTDYDHYELTHSSLKTFSERLQKQAPKPENEAHKRGYHLAPAGAAKCDYGDNVNELKCLEIGRLLAQQSGNDKYQMTLVVGNGGMCNEEPWGGVPAGCSVQSGTDWTAHFKYGEPTKEGCVNGRFQLVCTGNEVGYHLGPKGKNKCDYGKPVAQGLCLQAVGMLAKLEGRARLNTKLDIGAGGNCADGKWGSTPDGCSVKSGADFTAHFREIRLGKIDDHCVHDDFQVVCTGGKVPMTCNLTKGLLHEHEQESWWIGDRSDGYWPTFGSNEPRFVIGTTDDFVQECKAVCEEASSCDKWSFKQTRQCGGKCLSYTKDRNSTYGSADTFGGFCKADFHLAPPGFATCDHGKVVSEDMCLKIASVLARQMGVTMGNTTLSIGSKGECGKAVWGSAPGGCSIRTTDFSAHYKKGIATAKECVSTEHQLICTGLEDNKAAIQKVIRTPPFSYGDHLMRASQRTGCPNINKNKVPKKTWESWVGGDEKEALYQMWRLCDNVSFARKMDAKPNASLNETLMEVVGLSREEVDACCGMELEDCEIPTCTPQLEVMHGLKDTGKFTHWLNMLAKEKVQEYVKGKKLWPKDVIKKCTEYGYDYNTSAEMCDKDPGCVLLADDGCDMAVDTLFPCDAYILDVPKELEAQRKSLKSKAEVCSYVSRDANRLTMSTLYDGGDHKVKKNVHPRKGEMPESFNPRKFIKHWAMKAIDGDVDTCTLTSDEDISYAWLQVELGIKHKVSAIRLLAPEAMTADEARDVMKLDMSVNEALRDGVKIAVDGNVCITRVRLHPGEDKVVPCRQEGTIIKIETEKGGNVLSICEVGVQVMSTTADYSELGLGQIPCPIQLGIQNWRFFGEGDLDRGYLKENASLQTRLAFAYPWTFTAWVRTLTNLGACFRVDLIRDDGLQGPWFNIFNGTSNTSFQGGTREYEMKDRGFEMIEIKVNKNGLVEFLYNGIILDTSLPTHLGRERYHVKLTANCNRKELWVRNPEVKGKTSCVQPAMECDVHLPLPIGPQHWLGSKEVEEKAVAVIRPKNYIESEMWFTRPVMLQAEISTDTAACVRVMLLSKSMISEGSKAVGTGYEMSVGAEENVAALAGTIVQESPNNASQKWDDATGSWNHVQIYARGNGNVSYYVNGVLRATLRDNRTEMGPVAFFGHCTGMRVRNVTVRYHAQCAGAMKDRKFERYQWTSPYDPGKK